MTAISTFGYYTYVTFRHLCSVTIFVFLVLLVKCPLLKKKKYSMFGITVLFIQIESKCFDLTYKGKWFPNGLDLLVRVLHCDDQNICKAQNV